MTVHVKLKATCPTHCSTETRPLAESHQKTKCGGMTSQLLMYFRMHARIVNRTEHLRGVFRLCQTLWYAHCQQASKTIIPGTERCPSLDLEADCFCPRRCINVVFDINARNKWFAETKSLHNHPPEKALSTPGYHRWRKVIKSNGASSSASAYRPKCFVKCTLW